MANASSGTLFANTISVMNNVTPALQINAEAMEVKIGEITYVSVDIRGELKFVDKTKVKLFKLRENLKNV